MIDRNRPWVALTHLDELWFQVAGTRCNLTCHHCFISCSPHNHSFGFLSYQRVAETLKESQAHGVRDYYFTGGEPFLHPRMVDILDLTLQYGPATVLTNGTVLKAAWLERLREAERASRYSLEFRVSLDGFTAEMNDPIRGEGTFDRAIRGVETLVQHGFLPILTVARTWDLRDDVAILAGFCDLLRARGYDRPRLKILPTLQIGAEAERTAPYAAEDRVTAEMLDDYDTTQLVCSKSRIVTDRGVHVCPILIEDPASVLGATLADADRPYAIEQGACTTCWRHGAICSNAGR